MSAAGPPPGYDPGNVRRSSAGSGRDRARTGGGSRGRRSATGPAAGGGGRDSLRSWIGLLMAVGAAVTVLGLVALWPRGDAPDLGAQPRTYVDATVTGSRSGTCPGIEIPEQLQDCTVYDARLTSGSDSGDTIELQVRPTQTEVPDLAEGDDIVLLYVPSSPVNFQYSFYDFQRSSPMLWLGVVFVIVVVAFGRFQGLRALAGLGLSLLVLVLFLVPALLRDSPAVLVAVVGTMAVAYLAIYLAHGVGITSSIALAGSLVSLAATCALAVVVASLTQLSGLATEEAQVLRVTAEALDLRGLLIAGIVVGTLGVVDDVTVSQVSTVAALRRANPSFGPRQLYAEATKVGRDHVASAVNTLALAYAGASLPLLLFFAEGGRPVGRILTSELVAVEIVRMLVGSIGLVLSVPVTTRLAAHVLARGEPLPDDGHGHAHGLAPAPGPEPDWPGDEDHDRHDRYDGYEPYEPYEPADGGGGTPDDTQAWQRYRPPTSNIPTASPPRRPRRGSPGRTPGDDGTPEPWF